MNTPPCQTASHGIDVAKETSPQRFPRAIFLKRRCCVLLEKIIGDLFLILPPHEFPLGLEPIVGVEGGNKVIHSSSKWSFNFPEKCTSP